MKTIISKKRFNYSLQNNKICKVSHNLKKWLKALKIKGLNNV